MYINDIFHTFLEPTLLKFVVAGIMAFSFLFGDLYTQGVMAVLILMIFDTIMGVMCAYREDQPITSRKFSRVVQKGFVYMLTISSAYFADVTIGWNLIQATMIGFIGVTEFISILENAGRLGYQTPKKLLNQLKDFQSLK